MQAGRQLLCIHRFQPIRVKINPLEILKAVKRAWFNQGNLVAGQVQLGQVLEAKEGPRPDRDDGVALQVQCHQRLDVRRQGR